MKDSTFKNLQTTFKDNLLKCHLFEIVPNAAIEVQLNMLEVYNEKYQNCPEKIIKATEHTTNVVEALLKYADFNNEYMNALEEEKDASIRELENSALSHNEDIGDLRVKKSNLESRVKDKDRIIENLEKELSNLKQQRA